jgi:hypothetical protein
MPGNPTSQDRFGFAVFTSDLQSGSLLLICGEFGLMGDCGPTAKVGRGSVADRGWGFGQFGTPWRRIQRAKLRNSLHSCCTSA